MCQVHQGFLPPKIHSVHGKWCILNWVMLTKIATINTPAVIIMLIWYMVKTRVNNKLLLHLLCTPGEYYKSLNYDHNSYCIQIENILNINSNTRKV